MVDPWPATLGPDGLLRRKVMGDGVEEFVRHMGGSHGKSPQGGGLPTDGANPMPKRGGVVRACNRADGWLAGLW
jgi:hypothetical protein